MMERHMYKLICAILAFFSIIIDGPIIPIISFVVAVVMLVIKIKQAKESQEGFEMLMMDIACIVILIIIDIAIFAIAISVDLQYSQNKYSLSSKEPENTAEAAQMIIDDYKLSHSSQFDSKKNNIKIIKEGLAEYLRKMPGIYEDDVKIKGNQIIFTVGFEQIIFTVTQNDISFST